MNAWVMNICQQFARGLTAGRCCLLALVTCALALPNTAAAMQVFDGSDRVILYSTSSHGGHKELQELVRMVPGGEKMSVLKPPYTGRKHRKIR